MNLLLLTSLVTSLWGYAAAAVTLPEDYFYNACMAPLLGNMAIASLTMDFDPEDYDAIYGTYCTNKDILVTLYDCMEMAADLSVDMGYSHRDRKFKSSWKTMQTYCSLYYGTKNTIDVKEAASLWEAAPKPFVNYTVANETLQLPFSTPPELVSPLIVALQDEGDSYHDTAQYSYWTLYYVVICVGMATIFNCLTWLMPKGAQLTANNPFGRYVRRFITMPPLYNARLARWTHFHSSQLPALEIFGYFVMNYVMMSVNYRHNSDAYYSSRAQAIGYMLGYRSGIMPMFKLPFLFFFAGRNNFLITLTGWDYTVFSMWHRWLARFATLDILIHWAAYSVGIATIEGELAAEWRLWYWIAGVIATLIMVIMVVQGAVWLRRIAYEFFLYTHIVWAILFLVFTWYHVIWVTYPMETMYACFAVWGYDRVARFVRIALSGVCTADISVGADNVMVVDIKDKNPIRAFPGSHVFVYFLSKRAAAYPAQPFKHPLSTLRTFFARNSFYQSHPFTAIKTDTGLRLFVKSWNGMTKGIKETVIQNGGKMQMKVMVEGPYGVSLNLKSFDEVVCVAGGIGITSIYSHLSERIFSKSINQKVTLHWVVRHEEFFSTFSEDIRRFADAGIRVVLHVTNHGSQEISSIENTVSSGTTSLEKEKPLEEVSSQCYEIEQGRPDMYQLVPSCIEGATGSVAFLTCGPPSLNRDVRGAVAKNLLKTEHYVQCYEEGFEM